MFSLLRFLNIPDQHMKNQSKRSGHSPNLATTCDHSDDPQQMLTNTEMAMAKLTANAMDNGLDETAVKDFSMLQSTLFTLQNQQLLQLKLIEQLQSQLKSKRPKSVNRATSSKNGQGQTEMSRTPTSEEELVSSSATAKVNDVRDDNEGSPIG